MGRGAGSLVRLFWKANRRVHNLTKLTVDVIPRLPPSLDVRPIIFLINDRSDDLNATSTDRCCYVRNVYWVSDSF